ncbi:hypothetical protein B296_00037410, partial [Ensete ventricosum]
MSCTPKDNGVERRRQALSAEVGAQAESARVGRLYAHVAQVWASLVGFVHSVCPGICLAAVRLREKHRRRKKKERAFEEEGESREPRHELVTTPFLDPNLVSSHSLDDPDPGGNGEETHKEEDLEKRGSREATARAMEEVVSFITSPETSVAFDVLIAFFAECYRQGNGEKRRR